MSERTHDHHDHHNNAISTDVFGFWLYILTDCVLFGSLFATYAVLNHPGAYGPALKPLIDLPYVLAETFFLLGSNLTFGLCMIAMYQKRMDRVNAWLLATLLLGAAFVVMEVNEFKHLIYAGYSWHASGAASAFFTLVGTHGLHVSVGLLWIAVMMIQVQRFGHNSAVEKRLVMLGIFWNFLDIVWIFVFTAVYLTGAL